MNQGMQRLLTTLVLLVTSTAPWAADAPDVPTAPTEVVETGGSGESATATTESVSADDDDGGAAAQADRGSDADGEPTELTVKPGVTEVAPIAKGHLNRIVTPYASPQVRTTSSAKVEVDGSVLYVASDAEAPVSLYVMPEGSDTEALSLALVPRAIPPKEIRLRLDDAERRQRRADVGAARAWETSQPYVATIQKLLNGLARGRVPQGYGIDPLDDAMWQPRCDRPEGGDLEYDFQGIGQRVSGAALTAYVGRVTNVDDEVIELDERWCAGDRVVAVAFWPRIVVEPGDQAEVFVVRRRRRQPATQERSSLLEE